MRISINGNKKTTIPVESWSVSDVRKPSGHGLCLLQIIAVGYAFLSPATKRGLDRATGDVLANSTFARRRVSTSYQRAAYRQKRTLTWRQCWYPELPSFLAFTNRHRPGSFFARNEIFYLTRTIINYTKFSRLKSTQNAVTASPKP